MPCVISLSRGIRNEVHVVIRSQFGGNPLDSDSDRDDFLETGETESPFELELTRLREGRVFRSHGVCFPTESFICVIGHVGAFQLMWTEEDAAGSAVTGFMLLSPSVRLVPNSTNFVNTKWVGRGTAETSLMSIVATGIRLDLEAEDASGAEWARCLHRLLASLHELADPRPPLRTGTGMPSFGRLVTPITHSRLPQAEAVDPTIAAPPSPEKALPASNAAQASAHDLAGIYVQISASDVGAEVRIIPSAASTILVSCSAEDRCGTFTLHADRTLMRVTTALLGSAAAAPAPRLLGVHNDILWPNGVRWVRTGDHDKLQNQSPPSPAGEGHAPHGSLIKREIRMPGGALEEIQESDDESRLDLSNEGEEDARGAAIEVGSGGASCERPSRVIACARMRSVCARVCCVHARACGVGEHAPALVRRTSQNITMCTSISRVLIVLAQEIDDTFDSNTIDINMTDEMRERITNWPRWRKRW